MSVDGRNGLGTCTCTDTYYGAGCKDRCPGNETAYVECHGHGTCFDGAAGNGTSVEMIALSPALGLLKVRGSVMGMAAATPLPNVFVCPTSGQPAAAPPASPASSPTPSPAPDLITVIALMARLGTGRAPVSRAISA
jgi:hypothetical protein